MERASLIDAKGTVRAVEFSPHQFGLKIVGLYLLYRPRYLPYDSMCQATISADNNLRIYECLEQPSLATWQLSEEVDVLGLPSVSPGGHSLPQTVTQSTPTLTSNTLEAASATLQAHVQQQQSLMPNRPGLGTREADGGWCISWCKDRYWGEVIAVSAGVSGVVKVCGLEFLTETLLNVF